MFGFVKCGVHKNVVGVKIMEGVDKGAILLTKSQLDDYEELKYQKEAIIKEWEELQSKVDDEFFEFNKMKIKKSSLIVKRP